MTKAKSNRNQIDALERRLKRLESQLSQNSINHTQLFQDIDEQITLVKQDLEELYQIKANAAKLKCQANWIEGGEKCTRYFLSRQEHDKNKRAINRLRKGDVIVSDPKEISQMQYTFFKKLYTSINHTIDRSCLDGLHIPQVTQEDNYVLGAPIQLEEIHIAINQMANSKCPDNDGIPIEFYKCYWNEISHTLHSLFIKIVQDQKLNCTAREGFLSLADKPGKDPLELTNWRPLTLLNCDYKIFAKIIANRLKLVLPYLIHSDQTGFMKGRYITENIIHLQNIIDYCQKEKKRQ